MEIDYGRLDALESALGGRAAINAAYRNGAVLLTKGDKGDKGDAGNAGAAGAGASPGLANAVGAGGLANANRTPNANRPVFVIVKGGVTWDPQAGVNHLMQCMVGLTAGGAPTDGQVVAWWRLTRSAQATLTSSSHIDNFTLYFLVPAAFVYQIQVTSSSIITAVLEQVLS